MFILSLTDFILKLYDNKKIQKIPEFLDILIDLKIGMEFETF